MDEIIIRVARAVASRPRLRLLTCLCAQEDATPTALSGPLGVPLNSLSVDLRLLLSAGLVTRRKSGTWCHYAARSPYGPQTFSGQVTRFLRRVLSEAMGGNRGLQEVRDCLSLPAVLDAHEALFEAATAFTDLRRLQFLRRLIAKGPATVTQLTEELSMSPDAVSRHASKLVRRGYVVAHAGGARNVYALAPKMKSPLHARLFRIVRQEWEKEQSRTS